MNILMFISEQKQRVLAVISGFRRDIDEISALLGYYATSNGNHLSTFRENVSVPSSRVKTSKKKVIGCLETSVKDYHSTLRNTPEERRSHCVLSLLS
jgi:hypothetical protein